MARFSYVLPRVTWQDSGLPERVYSARPWKYDPVPRRDERFIDLFNQGVNAEACIYDEALPAKPSSAADKWRSRVSSGAITLLETR